MALRMGLNETILFEPDVFRTFDFSHYFPAIWQPPKCGYIWRLQPGGRKGSQPQVSNVIRYCSGLIFE